MTDWMLYTIHNNIVCLHFYLFFVFVGINLSKLKLQREFYDVAMMMLDYAFVFGLVECYYLVS